MIRIILGILRSLDMRCPNCHQGQLMKNWFEVNPACPVCSYEFQKESGDFWGGMVFSYTYAAVAGLAAAGVLIALDALTWSQRVYVAVAFGVASILLLHPITRANWVALMFQTRGQYEEYRPKPRA